MATVQVGEEEVAESIRGFQEVRSERRRHKQLKTSLKTGKDVVMRDTMKTRSELERVVWGLRLAYNTVKPHNTHSDTLCCNYC